jgi:tetratricopeptide (TPR) repeat protein
VKRTPLIATVLFLVVINVVVFGAVRHYGFANFDDGIYVYDNARVLRGFSLANLSWALFHPHIGHWHPLTWVSLMLDIDFFGVGNPGAQHAVNGVLHTASTLLLFFALKRMTNAPWPSAVVAALFAVHPIHVQPVVWITSRKDVLSTFFWFLALWNYARYVERRTLARYLFVAASLVLGLMTKPMLVTAPFLLLVLDYWPLGRMRGGAARTEAAMAPRRLVREKLALFFAAAFTCFMAYYAGQQHGVLRPLDALPLPVRMANAVVAYASYVGKIFWPHDFAIHHPHPGDTLGLWHVVGAVVFLAAVTLLALWVRRSRPYLLAGWLWYLGTLVPVIGIVQIADHGMADRYVYVPSVGIFIMVVWFAADVFRRWRYGRAAAASAALGAVAAFMLISRVEVGYWADNVALWQRTLRATSHNVVAHNNLGTALEAQGEFSRAVAEYSKAIEIDSAYVQAHNNLGNALMKLGRAAEAAEAYAEAIRLEPDYAQAHGNRANALMTQGEPEQALDDYLEAIRISPRFADARNNLEKALAMLMQRGEIDRAVAWLERRLQADPGDAEAHIYLGVVSDMRGEPGDAVAEFREAARIDPQNAVVHNKLGLAAYRRGDYPRAEGHFADAIRITPDDVGLHLNLGLTLRRLGRNREAADQFEKVLRIRPNHPGARDALEATRTQLER